MATDTRMPNVLETLDLDAERLDQQRGVDLWLRTWIALAVIVALTVIAYLIFISSSLASINTHLGTARDAVTDVNGNAKTLPGQIDAVNANLTQINQSLQPVPAQAEAIRADLQSVRDHGNAINQSLTGSSRNLASVAEDLGSSAPLLTHITSQLTDTSQLLTAILDATSAIDRNLITLNSNGPAGVSRTNTTVKAVVDRLQPTRAGLGNILSGLGSINVHLQRVCESPAINLLHGRQPC